MECSHKHFTGDETVYDADAWVPLMTRKNCIAYVMDNTTPTPVGVKATPGLRAGITRPLDLRSCEDTMARAMADNPGKSYAIEPCQSCKKGYYRVVMALDKNGGDFHWYKAHTSFKHKIESGDTYGTIARFYGISADKIAKDNGYRPLRVGDKIRVNTTGYSHKPGVTPTSIKDSCGNFLKDPRQAAAKGCADYGRLAYTVLCKDLCVRVGGLPTL